MQAGAGPSPAALLPPPSAAPLELLAGEGLGDGVPRGLLRLVPGGGTAAGIEASAAAGELVTLGGAVAAAVGSGLLVCATVRAAEAGEATPIDIADEYYGTLFGDLAGWLQGRYPPQASSLQADHPHALRSVLPGAVLDRHEEKRLRRGRIYVTYTKLNKKTNRYYSGRTSMVVYLDQPLFFQAVVAVSLRGKNHHLDENVEPGDELFAPPVMDRFDTGSAVDYGQRYGDIAYWRIRGREQQLIDSHGGARSDTGEPYRTENTVRGVAKENESGRQFHAASSAIWGELYPYTGY